MKMSSHFPVRPDCRFLGRVVCVFFILSPLISNAAPSLSLFIQGRTQPYLSLVNGGSIGVNPVTKTLENSLVNSDIEIKADLSNIQMVNPAAGTYNVTLAGTSEDIITIYAAYSDDIKGAHEEQTAMVLQHGNPLYFSVVYDPLQQPALQLISPVAPPASPKAANVGGTVQLRWLSPSDPTITAYRVYGRLEEIPKFSLLGETQSLSFDTGHVARSGDEGQHWQYVVVGKNAANRESFYYMPVNNLVQMLAVFSAAPTEGTVPLSVSFEDYSQGSPTAWEWDFDGDEIVDSTEQNPTHTYTQTGNYDVTLKVTGSLGISTRSEQGYITIFADTVDTDGDGVFDGSDNCSLKANPTQLDSDHDGFGNQCDCDFNQDNFCGGPDFTLFIGCFNKPTGGNPVCEAADMNGDGFVGGPDFTLFVGGFNKPPGPSGLAVKN